MESSDSESLSSRELTLLGGDGITGMGRELGGGGIGWKLGGG